MTAADWETFRAGDTPFESLLLKASAKVLPTHVHFAGRASSMFIIRHAVCVQGVSPEARSRVWPYILELWKPEWSEDKVAERLAVLRKEYQRLLDKCEVGHHQPTLSRLMSLLSGKANPESMICRS